MKSVSAGCRVYLDDVKETKCWRKRENAECVYIRISCPHIHYSCDIHIHTYIHKYVTVYQAFFLFSWRATFESS